MYGAEKGWLLFLESLIEQYKLHQLNKEDVLREVMTDYGADLTRLAYSYVKDITTAEDITQEVFLKCYTKLDSFKGNSSLKTWLNRITVNKCKDYLKSGWKKYIQFDLPLFKDPKTYETPESQVTKQVEHDTLTQFVLKLPVKYREVIILYYFHDQSTKEISESLNLKDTSVRTRLRRARQILEEHLDKRNEEE
ncbi:sigma-70 family RNA polymerase sigma factor [Alkalihalobacillus sp. AL-G]|uniref:sigma-70 family RNA polymerase sigma factor n=1 Tax=Alkalihalobacillus sp. AL-G TaxID=2926399 RepID=UPI00272AB0A5|nr:sigma-70 family RNA polymerase sigma factor [Alkalihalobacillus sp. AL-G]WLD91744.1 sigma-70 family RNA polymerase sigma factor [Alkalihalobacillus sp. AL-G]